MGQVNTLDLINATGTTTLVNDGSSRGLIFSNVGSSATTIGVENTDQATTVRYTNTTGAQSVNLNISNVGTLDLDNDIIESAVINIAGVETANINVTADSAINLRMNALTTANITGGANLFVFDDSGTTNKVTNVNASTMTGDLLIDMGTQSGVLSSTVVSVTGGSGNDIFDVDAVAPIYSVNGGSGDDDFIVGGNLTTSDSIQGGEGEDTLITTSAIATTISSVNGVNGIDTLEIQDTLTGSVTLANVDSTIDGINLNAGFGALSGAATVVGGAGTLSIALGSEDNNNGVLGGALTATDTGTAITDTLSVTNNGVNSVSGAALDIFGGNNLTSNGYETVGINTGLVSNTQQTIGTLNITADVASAPVTLNAQGTSSLLINAFTTNSTGLTTINASGLSVANNATVTGLTLNGTTLGALGTQSVVGTAGRDFITVGNFASTIDGGAGNDSLVGGTLADSIRGGEGNDTITGSGGNDTLHGNEGNDTINATVAGVVNIDGGAGNDTVNVGATLGVTDTVKGGEGTADILSVTAAITGTTGVGISEFEVLQTTADQVMSNAINNAWTTVFADAASIAISNASGTLNTYQIRNTATGAQSFSRLTDTGTDSLTIQTVIPGSTSTTPAQTTVMASFTANEEESITIDNSVGTARTGSLTIGTLNASDLTSLTLSGDNAITITNAIVGATSLATVNASAMTAAVSVNASTSNVALTATGAAAYANTLTTGSGADSITGGTAADRLTGNNGADTLVGGAGNDTLLGGQGNDSINASTGEDSIDAGIGADTITLSVDGETDRIVQGAAASVAATATNIAGANFAAGDTITYGNGVDIINNFRAGATGGDVLESTATNTSLLGTAAAAVGNGWLSGTYANGVFTVSSNGTGPDVLVLQGGNLAAATPTGASAVVLLGVDSDNFVNANFTGAFGTNLTATYAATTWTLNGAAATALTIDATSATPNVTPAAGVTFAGTYAPGAVTIIDLSTITGGNGSSVNLSGVINAALASVIGTSGADNFIYANGNDLGRAAVVSIAGGAGTDTLTFTTQTGAQTLGSGAFAGAGQGNITSIENIVLTAGNGAALTLDNTLTVAANGSAVAVRNASATAGATVALGTGAAHSYTSGSSGADVVTLGVVGVAPLGQSVTLSGGGADNVNTTIAASFGSTYTGSAAATETLTFTDNGANISLGATAAADRMAISGVDTIVLANGANTVTVTPGQNITIDATVGGAATTIVGTGNTINVTQDAAAGATLALSGTSAYNVTSGAAGAAITSTGTGALTVTTSAGAQTVTSASATTVNATLLAAALTGAGTGNFTVTGLGNNATFVSTTTGTSDLTLAAGAVIIVDNQGGAMTVDASAQIAGETVDIAATSASVITINGVTDSSVNATGGATAATGGLNVVGATAGAGVTQVLFGTAGVDTFTTTGTGAVLLNAGTAGGNDIINLLGTAIAIQVNAGQGADTVIVGTGAATAVLVNGDTGANNAAGVFTGTTTFDVYTGFAAGDVLNLGRAAAFAGVTASTTSVAGANETIAFTRGTYDAALQLFTASAVGTDTLVTYDLGAAAAVDLEAIVLVGFVGTSDVGVANAGTLDVTLI